MKTRHYHVDNRLIDQDPPVDLALVIVIPAYNEPDVLSVLDALAVCHVPDGLSIEVIYVFNASDEEVLSVKSTNEKGSKAINTWCLTQRNLPFKVYPILIHDLPSKKAGVGLARKIGMDEAWRRLMSVDQNEGLIINLDADCTVQANYLNVLNDWRQNAIGMEGASLYFEHPMPKDTLQRDAIIAYELHLRYFIEMQRHLHLPYAFHTVGSSMVVRAEAYGIVGGMNKRKAGEDFYFLHKLIKRGQYEDVVETCVYPSARVSNRVPFGTGKAIMDHIDHHRYEYTYSPNVFLMLQETIFDIRSAIRNGDEDIQRLSDSWSEPVKVFLNENGLPDRWREVFQHTSTPDARLKRFFNWFDAFLLMKYCHFCRDLNVRYQSTVRAAVVYLLSDLRSENIEDLTSYQLLEVMRGIQRVPYKPYKSK